MSRIRNYNATQLQPNSRYLRRHGCKNIDFDPKKDIKGSQAQIIRNRMFQTLKTKKK